MTDATFAVANPSDSILIGLARVALKPGSIGGVAAWPKQQRCQCPGLG